jgi:hypothetical protein
MNFNNAGVGVGERAPCQDPSLQVVAGGGAGGRCEVGAFYWTVLAPDIVNPGREEQGSASV